MASFNDYATTTNFSILTSWAVPRGTLIKVKRMSDKDAVIIGLINVMHQPHLIESEYFFPNSFVLPAKGKKGI
jgi:hypothetical protein